MMHDNDRVSTVEARMQEIARDELKRAKFEPRAASDIRRSGDYLSKIIHLIRGCGFGVAIFSDATPARTLANIFFEVGYCLALGKQTFLLVAGRGAAPSDFVRSEWIEYQPGKEEDFRHSLRDAFSGVDEYAEFLEELAFVAEDAEEMDPELAYERFKRAYLVSGSAQSRDGIGRVLSRLRIAGSETALAMLMRSYRRRLLDEVGNFERLCRKI